jgi:hypothetical protein
VLHRFYFEDRALDSLPAAFRVVKDALEELKLVLCRSRVLLGTREDHVLDLRAP